MSGSIYMAATGALAAEKRLHIISNNLANVNTAGFKKDGGRFQAFNLSSGTEEIQPPAAGVRSDAPHYWMLFSSFTDFASGGLKKTGNPYDLALNGRGFFCVQTPNGIQFTRRGDFTINADEMLVTQEGWPVLGLGGEIQVEMKNPTGEIREFTISEDGYLTVDGSQIDRLRVVDFPMADGLAKVGHNYYRATNPYTHEEDLEDFSVNQGFLETSNVNVIQAMTEMIEVLRGYESYQKIIRSSDDMDARLINDVGKSA